MLFEEEAWVPGRRRGDVYGDGGATHFFSGPKFPLRIGQLGTSISSTGGRIDECR